MRKQEFLGKLLLTYTVSIELGWEWGKRARKGVEWIVMLSKLRHLSSPELGSVFVT